MATAAKRRYGSWSEKERAVLRAELDRNMHPEHGYTERLQPLLPGRSKQAIRNHLNIMRRKLHNQCNCGEVLPEGQGYCDACRAKTRKKRENRLARGLCTSCGSEIDPKGSTTLCSSCLEYHRKYYPNARKSMERKARAKGKLKPKGKEQTTLNLLGWKAGRTGPFFLRNLPQDALVVDLFGGSGDFGLRAKREGFDLLAYNDVHPMLVSHLRVLQAGLWQELWDANVDTWSTHSNCLRNLKGFYSSTHDEAVSLFGKGEVKRQPFPKGAPEWDDLLRFASVLYTVARSVEKRDLVACRIPKVKRPAPGHMKLLRDVYVLLEDVEVTCLDFAAAIPYHDCSKSVFLCDPPWPGDTGYEYTIEGRYGELVEALVNARGRFILTMQSSKTSLVAMAPIPHLYWLPSIAGAKLLVGSSFPLQDPLLTPVEKSRYGYL